MDLHHTGSSELIYIETDKVSVTIKGNAAHPDAPGIEYSDKVSSLKIYCTEKIDELVIKGEGMDAEQRIHTIAPVFFEQKQYEIIIEGTDNNTVSFWHANKKIRDRVTKASKRLELLSGIINFGNEIGLSDLIINVNGKEYLKITIEVFPSKISYQEDYKAIVDDVTKEIHNAIFDFLKKTYQGYQQSGTRKSSLPEFFAIISAIYDDFLRATDKIINQPHHLLQTYHEVMPAHKIKKTDSQTRKWIEKHPSYVQKKDGRINVEKALAVKKQITFDTKENRLTKFMLKDTVKKLELLKKQYLQLQREEDPAVSAEIDGMIKKLNRRHQNSFLKEVSEATENSGMSLVFSMAPGYRELYKYYLMLQRGLDVTGDVFNISVKDLAVLYEYWCFIKLNSILKKKYDLISQDIIRVEGNKLIVSLVKGQNSKVRYKNVANGESIVLSYNPKESKLPTVSQRPDNVLTLEKNSLDGTKPTYEYVFDAKYKIDMALEGSYYHKYICDIPGPKEEDINTMHRYRDAIVSEKSVSNYERTMFGAYVLFPYSDEEKYKAHKFYKSIEKVNIGGLPFLPSATKLVEDMLDQLIADSPETVFERTTLPLGTEEKLKKVDWSKKDVFVGLVRSEEELTACIDKLYYQLSMELVHDEKLPVHYVALYQSDKMNGKDAGIYLYGEVLRTTVVKRRDTKGIEKAYYRFVVRQWMELDRPIIVREQVEQNVFTNKFLLHHSPNMAGLRIESEEEYRTYMELKRMLNSDVVDDSEHPVSFKLGDNVIDYDQHSVRVKKHGAIVARYVAEEFNRRPSYWFGKMMEEVEGEE